MAASIKFDYKFFSSKETLAVYYQSVLCQLGTIIGRGEVGFTIGGMK